MRGGGFTLVASRQHLPDTPAIRREFKHLSRDQASFLAVSAVKVILGVAVLTREPLLGIVFLAAYALFSGN